MSLVPYLSYCILLHFHIASSPIDAFCGQMSHSSNISFLMGKLLPLKALYFDNKLAIIKQEI